MIKRLVATSALLVGLLASGCAPDTSNSPAAKVDAARLTAAGADGDNWMSYGRT